MEPLFNWIKEILIKGEKKEEKEYFNNMKNGLKESMHEINETLKDIQNWVNY